MKDHLDIRKMGGYRETALESDRLRDKRLKSNKEYQGKIDKLASNSVSQESVDNMQKLIASDAENNRTNRDTLKVAVDILHKVRPELNGRYQIHVNHDYNKLQLHLVDRNTGKVIQKIPSNHLLAFYNNIEKLTGFLLEEKG